MRISISLALIALTVIAGCGGEEVTEPQRPNIIFLMADDQRADAFGFAGNADVITPNLDRLAADGIVFENAYHVAPICQPSRASVMTGRYLSTHGAGFDRPTDYIITAEEFASSYPVLLQKHGYYTGFIGKFGFAVGGDTKLRNKGFQNRQEYMPSGYFDRWNGFPGQGRYQPRNGSFNGYENRSGATHLTEFMGDQAIEFVEQARDSGKPFALSVSFKAPHAPFEPADQFRNMYDGRSVSRMANDKPEYHDNLPGVVREKSRNARWYFGRSRDYYGEEVGYRSDWHIERDSVYEAFIKNYYALITGIDHAVGRIRTELDRLGVADNTVLVYSSDNGFFAGSKQLMGKALLYEESAKAPMIVYDPRLPVEEGVQSERGLISHVDIAPTLLDLAGITPPEHYPGKSFMPIVNQDREQVHEAVYGENNFDDFYPLRSEVENPESYRSIRSRFVRVPEYKYIRYHENRPVTEELYRITRDPLETRNLIDDPEYAEIARDLRHKMDLFEERVVRQSPVFKN